MLTDMANKMDSGKRPKHQVAPPPSIPPPICPRCTSDRTKFCYYNNYNVCQPRYYCKDCRRYWTHGGAIRNIPTGGTTRKRGRGDAVNASSSSSSSSPVWKPATSGILLSPSATWGLGVASDLNPGGGSFGFSGIGDDTFRPPVTETMLSFNGGGSSYQTPFGFSPGGDQSGGLNTAFGALNVGFGGEAPPITPRPNQMLTNHYPVDDFVDYGSPFLQQPQHHYQPPPPPPPPVPPQSVWPTGQNVPFNSSSTTFSTNNFQSATSYPAASGNVGGMNQWSEYNDMDYEYDPFQSYKPPFP